MNTKMISEKSLDVIKQYKDFTVGSATCSMPYFNNKHTRRRASLRVFAGKGSPKEIYDEVRSELIRTHQDESALDSDGLKKLLVDQNLGIDCSAFVYHVLDIPDRHLHFPFSRGILGKIKAKIRPVENTDVATLAHNSNSKIITLSNAQPGDIITMTNNENKRNHILLIYQIEYQNFLPITFHYIHAVAWPTDGQYNHGVREGKITITSLDKTIVEQSWVENGKDNEENYTFAGAKESQTELRRLSFLC